jgi:hypothetical protein
MKENENTVEAMLKASLKWCDIYHHGKKDFPVIELAAVEHGFKAGLEHARSQSTWVEGSPELCECGHDKATHGRHHFCCARCDCELFKIDPPVEGKENEQPHEN